MKGLIDTNILVYATDEESRLHKKAKLFLEDSISKETARFCPQVFNEFFNVLSSGSNKKLRYEEIKSTLSFYKKKFEHLMIYPKDRTYKKSIDIAIKNKVRKNGKIFDIYLAQTALDNLITTVYTHNAKDFSLVKGVKCKIPPS
ncbi:MAG: type II toxin-antitoxin system VapC family toxin [Candidatus Dojkabacteria bacterium]